jgi:hypothetical protein
MWPPWPHYGSSYKTSNENLQGYFQRMERHSALHLASTCIETM